MGNKTLREKLNFVFKDFSANINKFFILAGRLATDIYYFSKILRRKTFGNSSDSSYIPYL